MTTTTAPMIPISTANLQQVFDAFEESMADGLWVARPARVKKYDASGPKADIELMQMGIIEGEVVSLAILPNVPVLFPRSAKFGLTWPLEEGDTGLVVFCDRFMDSFKSMDPAGPPCDYAWELNHDPNNGVFIPGLWPFGKGKAADANDVVLAFGDSEARIAQNGGVTLSSNLEVIVKAPSIKVGDGATEPIPLGTSLKTLLYNHTHSFAGTGTVGESVQLMALGAWDAVLSTAAKVK